MEKVSHIDLEERKRLEMVEKIKTHNEKYKDIKPKRKIVIGGKK
jgi:hypothetical protein